VDLYVIRHAIAFERDASRWPDDRDRPLTAGGIGKFRRAARGLGKLVPAVDILLSSPLVRAWRTAELLADEAGWPRPVVFEALEPDREPSDVAKALAEYRDRESVAVVGHEPQLGELIGYLVVPEAGEHAPFALRKGGAACVLLGDDPPGHAALKWLITPKIERRLEG